MICCVFSALKTAKPEILDGIKWAGRGLVIICHKYSDEVSGEYKTWARGEMHFLEMRGKCGSTKFRRAISGEWFSLAESFQTRQLCEGETSDKGVSEVDIRSDLMFCTFPVYNQPQMCCRSCLCIHSDIINAAQSDDDRILFYNSLTQSLSPDSTNL